MIKNWTYNKKEINSISDMQAFIPKVWGFVYHLTLINKKTKKVEYFYIGKKNVYSIISKTATKKEFESNPKSYFQRKKMKNGTWKYYNTVIKESNWKEYTSSNNFIKDHKNDYDIVREIVCFCSSDSELTYLEAKEIICNDALENQSYLNYGVSLRKFIKPKNI